MQILSERSLFLALQIQNGCDKSNSIRELRVHIRTRKMVGFRIKLCSRLITFLLVLYFGSALPNQRSNDDLTQEVLSSMIRVLSFFKRDYKSINLDGIFGLRVAQGEY